MLRRVFAAILVAAALAALLPVRPARAEAAQALLVYEDEEQLNVLGGLIEACGLRVAAVRAGDYMEGLAAGYPYVVLGNAGPLNDVLNLGKRVVCIGDSFESMPGGEVRVLRQAVRAKLSACGNAQSALLKPGTPYIATYGGETIGSVTIHGQEYPLCTVGETIFYAPYLNGNDLSLFAAAQLLKRYFGLPEGGKLYVLVDAVTPFHDASMLERTARRLYENGIPFIMSLMPVYYNTGYPSFARYTDALRYIQSLSGSFVLHEPIVTGNELVGDDLETRMDKARVAFAENGVHVFSAKAFPYRVSLALLETVEPVDEVFIRMPLDMAATFDVPGDEAALDAAIGFVRRNRLQLGDYRRFFTNASYSYMEEPPEEDFVYRKKEESRYAFLVNAGNRMLLAVVLLSAALIIGLMLRGRRLYREKFFREKPARKGE